MSPLRTSRVATLLASSILALGALHAMQGLVGTWAAYADTATLAGPGFTAATVAPPSGVVCVNNGSQDYITWTAPGGTAPTAYRIHVNGSATATATVGPTVSQWRPATTFFPQTFTDVRVVAVRGSWTSVPSATSDSISTLFLFQGTSC